MTRASPLPRLLAAVVPCLCACAAVGPDYEAPELEVPEGFIAPPPDVPEDAADPWWRGFRDPVLDELVRNGLEANIDLAEALARLDEARATVRAARSGLYPVFDGQVSGTTRSDFGGDTTDAADAGFVLAFVPDLFGGQRRRIEAARAAARAASLQLVDVRRLTAAAIAQQYIELRRTQARLALLDTSLELQQQTLEIVEARRTAGLSADLDVQRAAADLARTRAQRGLLQNARARARNALAVLLGRPPDAELAPPDREPTIPSYASGPAVGLPAALLRNRPDVRAAEQALVAATAGIGVEVADLWPTLRMPGALTTVLAGAGPDVLGTLTADLALPLVDGGGRRADVRAAEARAQGAVARYEQAVLDSLEDVENALVAIQSFTERNAELERAVRASERAFDQLDALYREGLATFIDILDAQRQLIGSRESFVDSEAALASAVVQLYAAVGAPVPGQQTATGSD